MKGFGVSFGAISVMNAIPCGIGSTIGIDLRTEAEFKDSDVTRITLVDRPRTNPGLVATCVRRTRELIGAEQTDYELTVRTQIPPSVGLKSSSSVCNAVISAVLDAYGKKMDMIDIIKLGVECAKECNVTITGAFDDACGCGLGGLVITDNRTNELLYSEMVPEYDVVLVIPERTIPKNKVPIEYYTALKEEFEPLVNKIRTDYLKVLTRNGSLVDSIVCSGTRYAKIALNNGALAAGVTGTGPAIAIITEKGKGKEMADIIGPNTIITRTRNKGITFFGGQANGTVSVPPSKSYTHRAIIMAALSGGPCIISNPLESFDTDATIEAVRSMGATVTKKDGGLLIETHRLHAPDRTINVLNSGTTMRLIAGIAASFDSEVTITGDRSICKRPMGPLLDALKGCGAECTSDNGHAPITIKGPIDKDVIGIDGSISSQFISSILIVAPLIGRPVDIIIHGSSVSRPYIEITLSMMERFGIKVEHTNEGYHVEPQKYTPCDFTVPADFSSAAFPLAAGGLSGKVSVNGLDMNDPQGDRKIISILNAAGCSVLCNNNVITSSYNSRIKALDIDISDIPDLFPILAVLMSTADGTSRLYGAPQLRFKESDRIESVTKMLTALGADIIGTDDGCIIRGVERLKGGSIDHKGDHRLMMAASIASLVSDGPISMEDDACWNVSYPGFVEQMRSLGLRC